MSLDRQPSSSKVQQNRRGIASLVAPSLPSLGSRYSSIAGQEGLTAVSRAKIERRALGTQSLASASMPARPASIDSRFRALKRLGEVKLLNSERLTKKDHCICFISLLPSGRAHME